MFWICFSPFILFCWPNFLGRFEKFVLKFVFFWGVKLVSFKSPLSMDSLFSKVASIWSSVLRVLPYGVSLSKKNVVFLMNIMVLLQVVSWLHLLWCLWKIVCEGKLLSCLFEGMVFCDCLMCKVLYPCIRLESSKIFSFL